MKNTNSNDPIVVEVRAAREEQAAQFRYNIREIFKDLRARQETSGRKYVRYPARPTTVKTSGKSDESQS